MKKENESHKIGKEITKILEDLGPHIYLHIFGEIENVLIKKYGKEEIRIPHMITLIIGLLNAINANFVLLIHKILKEEYKEKEFDINHIIMDLFKSTADLIYKIMNDGNDFIKIELNSIGQVLQ